MLILSRTLSKKLGLNNQRRGLHNISQSTQDLGLGWTHENGAMWENDNKPSPSHHHFYRWYKLTIPSHGCFIFHGFTYMIVIPAALASAALLASATRWASAAFASAAFASAALASAAALAFAAALASLASLNLGWSVAIFDTSQRTFCYRWTIEELPKIK